jgi:hypothetical protein
MGRGGTAGDEPIGVAAGKAARQAKPDAKGGIAGAGSQTKKTQGSRSSTLRVRGGKREMKGYALTKVELWTLGGLQGGAAASFSIAGVGFGLWISTAQQIQFANSPSPEIAGYWQGIGDMAFYGMIGFVILGAVLFFLSGLNVIKIINATDHD